MNVSKPKYDRTSDDLGDIVEFVHVNGTVPDCYRARLLPCQSVTVPDQGKAISFHITGPGLTRDPFIMAGIEKIRVNVGRSLITEQTNRHHHRFVNIVDVASDTLLFQVEHEVHGMSHPMYTRTHINRHPDVTRLAFSLLSRSLSPADADGFDGGGQKSAPRAPYRTKEPRNFNHGYPRMHTAQPLAATKQEYGVPLLIG